MFGRGAFKEGEDNAFCGSSISENPKGKMNKKNRDEKTMRTTCCANEGSDSTGDCDSASWPKGPAFNSILTWASNEKAWLNAFTRAWQHATVNGQWTNLTKVTRGFKKWKGGKKKRGGKK